MHRTPYVILNDEDRIVIVPLGRPREDESVPIERRYTMAMTRLAIKFDNAHHRAEHVLTGGRRGNFGAISVGTSFGGSQKALCALSVKGITAVIAKELMEDKDAQHLAGFGPFGLASYFPKVHSHMVNILDELYKRIPSLKKVFPNSEYPACTFNLGPDTVCCLHNNCGNSPGIPCVVGALGDFDADRGGNFVVWDLMLCIRFPAASSIAVPSAGVGHCNTEIQPGEKRLSLTQYFAGGIMRWASRGFRLSRFLSAAEKDELDGGHEYQWASQLSRFSRFKNLRADREQSVQWEAECHAHRSRVYGWWGSRAMSQMSYLS
ncbi:hypothetical protein OF83DRAFT_1068410 [Amylostereum chailletii]|nr:hypothetical protein OF83DRAFT_1068410 [Amylostereum chailletii]